MFKQKINKYKLNHHIKTCMLTIMLSIPFFSTPTLAINLEQTIQSDVPDGSGFFGNLFGEHIDSNDKWVVVGVPRQSVDLDNNGTIEFVNADGQNEKQAGAVFIYKRGKHGLVLKQKIVAFGNSTNDNGDRFGSAVTLFGNDLLIGAANDTKFPDGTVDPIGENFFFAGKVYVYRLDKKTNTWYKTNNELTSDEPITNGAFGSRTDAARIAVFPKRGVVVVGEQGNSDETVSKLHVFQKWGKKYYRRQTILSEQFDNFGPDVVMSNNLIAVGDNYVLASERVQEMPNQDLVLYKLKFNNKLTETPVQRVKLPEVDLIISEQSKTDLADLFGIPEEQRPFFDFIFDTNRIFCDFLLETGQGGMAAAKDIVVVSNPCGTQSGEFAELNGELLVYKFRAWSHSPLTLNQTIPAPSNIVLYGINFFNATQNVATNGKQILVGTAYPIDTWGGPVTDFPVYDEQTVDLYTRNHSGLFSLTTSIESPDPTIDNGGFGALYGVTVHFLSEKKKHFKHWFSTKKKHAEFLITNGGAVGNGSGKVYRFKQ